MREKFTWSLVTIACAVIVAFGAYFGLKGNPPQPAFQAYSETPSSGQSKEVAAYKIMSSPVSAAPETNVITITGIVFSSDNPSAVIGGSIVHEGNIIHGVKVVKIYKDRIELEKSGKSWTQQVSSPPKIDFEPTDLSDAQLFCNKGLKELEQGNWSAALTCFQKAKEMNPQGAKRWFYLGVAYGRLGRHQEAIEAFKQTVRIKPDAAVAYRNLGIAYGNLGRHQEAVEVFKQAIRIKPDDAVAYRNLGIAYGNLGHRMTNQPSSMPQRLWTLEQGSTPEITDEDSQAFEFQIPNNVESSNHQTLKPNAYGLGVHMNRYGQPVTLQPDFGGVPGETLIIKPDAYGMGVHSDQYGRPVREYTWP